MFHAHYGWFFERLDDGSVHIVKHESGNTETRIIAEAVFNANTWASIIASVSAGGEDDGRFFTAAGFHASKGAIAIIPK